MRDHAMDERPNRPLRLLRAALRKQGIGQSEDRATLSSDTPSTNDASQSESSEPRTETPPKAYIAEAEAKAGRNDNRCIVCLEAGGDFVPSDEMGGAGVCGECGGSDLVFDMPLLAFYFAADVPMSHMIVQTYWATLPKLRKTWSHSNERATTWEELRKITGVQIVSPANTSSPDTPPADLAPVSANDGQPFEGAGA